MSKQLAARWMNNSLYDLPRVASNATGDCLGSIYKERGVFEVWSEFGGTQAQLVDTVKSLRSAKKLLTDLAAKAGYLVLSNGVTIR